MTRDLFKNALRTLIGVRAYEDVHARIWARRLRAERQTAMTRIIERFVRTGDTCIDIGAHGGAVSFELSRAVGARGAVFAFEPRADYARTLERTLRLLDAVNVKVFPVALGDSNGESRLVIADRDGDITGKSHLVSGIEDRAKTQPVVIRSLDSLSDGYPLLLEATFVKIDVEGAELQILKGGVSFFAAAKPVLYCEIADEWCSRYGHSEETVREMIVTMGYSIRKIEGGDFLCVPLEKRDMLENF